MEKLLGLYEMISAPAEEREPMERPRPPCCWMLAPPRLESGGAFQESSSPLIYLNRRGLFAVLKTSSASLPSTSINSPSWYTLNMG